jgi:hypothetical protein
MIDVACRVPALGSPTTEKDIGPARATESKKKASER